MEMYGLIGKSLSHSFSQKYFTQKFQDLGIENAEYINIELEKIDDFKSKIEGLNCKGLNVTIPYKEAIIPYLDELDDTAKVIGAVNTIVFNNGKLIGYNTDSFGFHQTVKPYFKSYHEKALILGTGGASKAVEFVLKKYGVDVYFVTRNETKNNVLNWKDVSANLIKHHLLIINTTPLGMYPDIASFPKLNYEALTDRHLLVDLVYNPPFTEFLKKGKAQGAITINGLTMLHQQAEKSWRLWNSL